MNKTKATPLHRPHGTLLDDSIARSLNGQGYEQGHAVYTAKDKNKQELVDIMRIVASKMDQPCTDAEIEEIYRNAVIEVSGKPPENGSFIHASRRDL